MDFIIEDTEKESKEYVKGSDNRENAIEWYSGNDTVTLSLTQGAFKNRIRQLAAKYPQDVFIQKENKDGSILAKIPKSYLPLPRKPREVSEKRREEARENLNKYWEKKKSKEAETEE